MKKFIKENWFKIAILIIIIVISSILLRQYTKSYLYKMNTDCIDRAYRFSLEIKNESSYYVKLVQAKFSKLDNTCYAEMYSPFLTIYNLNNRKIIAFYPDVSDGVVNDQKLELSKKYDEVKVSIFGE